MPDAAQRDITLRHFVVGLFDILNQRQELARLTQFTSATNEELEAAMRATVGTVGRIRKTFRNYVEGFCEINKDTLQLAASSGPGKAEQYLRLMKTTIKCQNFSDTTVLFSPVHVADGVMPLKEVYGMICGAGTGMQVSLAEKIAVRGEIDVGAGCELEHGEVYGPVLASAYQLEQECARYTRIVVGSTLLDLLRKAAESQATGIHAITASTAKRCLDLVIQDDDGQYMVDIFSPKLVELIRSEKTSKVFRDALVFVGEEKTRFERCQHTANERCKCSRHAAGYKRLQGYLLERAPYWR